MNKIINILKQKKSIPLDQFIDISLYDKKFGYYMKKNPLGKIDANGLVTASLRFIPTAKNVTSKNSKIDVTSVNDGTPVVDSGR